jgi:hypothetical protein
LLVRRAGERRDELERGSQAIDPGRSCFAIEIDPAYVDVAVLRWQAFTGSTAMLECAGRSFAEVAAERQVESAG